MSELPGPPNGYETPMWHETIGPDWLGFTLDENGPWKSFPRLTGALVGAVPGFWAKPLPAVAQAAPDQSRYIYVGGWVEPIRPYEPDPPAIVHTIALGSRSVTLRKGRMDDGRPMAALDHAVHNIYGCPVTEVRWHDDPETQRKYLLEALCFESMRYTEQRARMGAEAEESGRLTIHGPDESEAP